MAGKKSVGKSSVKHVYIHDVFNGLFCGKYLLPLFLLTAYNFLQ